MNALKVIKAMLTPSIRATPADCMARVREGSALLVDVREASEWGGGFARSAALLPLSDLKGARNQWAGFLSRAGDRELLLYCAAGARAGMAAGILAGEGFKAANAGGFCDWVAAGWPVENLSTERP
jgi:rhodanese-related sulfurtransferase